MGINRVVQIPAGAGVQNAGRIVRERQLLRLAKKAGDDVG
jgi:hypothetical protein